MKEMKFKAPNEQVELSIINFNFSSHAMSLTDLMYKTTNSQEITQIRQKLALLHS